MNKRILIIAATAAALFTSGVYAHSNPPCCHTENNPPIVKRHSCLDEHKTHKCSKGCRGINHCKKKHTCAGMHK